MVLGKRFGLFFFLFCLGISFYVGRGVDPTWTVKKESLDMRVGVNGLPFFDQKGDHVYLSEATLFEHSSLYPSTLNRLYREGWLPDVEFAYVYEIQNILGAPVKVYYRIQPYKHWGWWSLFPVFVALVLCWLTREPISSLFSGVFCGAFILGQYNITDAVLIPRLINENVAGVIVLYLWLLAGLMGVWSRTGATQSFADFITRYFVKGPRSAKLSVWCLSLLFFQGGTVSAVMVGTSLKSVSDREKVSHEELSYLVDAMASPVASQLPFNAWPIYVQSFIYVTGVSWLATDTLRIRFFFDSLPFSFFAMLTILSALFLCFDCFPFGGSRLKRAMLRAREEGSLDGPLSEPLLSTSLSHVSVPLDYRSSVWDFILPVFVLVGVTLGTFFVLGIPQVRWGFFLAILVAMIMAMSKGMSLRVLMDGVGDGVKGVSVGALILLLAIVVGDITADAGGPLFLIDLLSDSVSYWLVPAIVFLLCVFISFSTGSSWGAYAVTLPVLMPFCWAIANTSSLSNPRLFMLLCFSAIIDGGVFGDQCSPISDTTVLTSICTGSDLMDHVKSQLGPALIIAGISLFLWTATALLFT